MLLCVLVSLRHVVCAEGLLFCVCEELFLAGAEFARGRGGMPILTVRNTTQQYVTHEDTQ